MARLERFQIGDEVARLGRKLNLLVDYCKAITPRSGENTRVRQTHAGAYISASRAVGAGGGSSSTAPFTVYLGTIPSSTTPALRVTDGLIVCDSPNCAIPVIDTADAAPRYIPIPSDGTYIVSYHVSASATTVRTAGFAARLTTDRQAWSVSPTVWYEYVPLAVVVVAAGIVTISTIRTGNIMIAPWDQPPVMAAGGSTAGTYRLYPHWPDITGASADIAATVAFGATDSFTGTGNPAMLRFRPDFRWYAEVPIWL